MSVSTDIAKEVASRKVVLDLSEMRVEDVHDAGSAEFAESGLPADDMMLVVELSAPYMGELPDTVRVLNALVMDWVTENTVALSDAVRERVIAYMGEYYPDVDVSELEVSGTDILWPDQVDYFSSLDPEDGRVHFSVDLSPEFEDF